MWKGELVCSTRVGDGARDARLHLAKGESFAVVVKYADGTRADLTVAP
jgi:hypothetical protein